MKALGIFAGQCGINIGKSLYKKYGRDAYLSIYPLYFTSTRLDLGKPGEVLPKYVAGIDSYRGVVLGKEDRSAMEVQGGIGGDVHRAWEIADAHKESFNEQIGAYLREIGTPQIIFIVTSLGGGTGSGFSPKFAEFLKEMYGREMKIMVIGILPTRGEGTPPSYNAYTTLEVIFNNNFVDGLILVDNEKWAGGGIPIGKYRDINKYVARFLARICVVSKATELTLDSKDLSAITSHGKKIKEFKLDHRTGARYPITKEINKNPGLVIVSQVIKENFLVNSPADFEKIYDMSNFSIYHNIWKDIKKKTSISKGGVLILEDVNKTKRDVMEYIEHYVRILQNATIYGDFRLYWHNPLGSRFRSEKGMIGFFTYDWERRYDFKAIKRIKELHDKYMYS